MTPLTFQNDKNVKMESTVLIESKLDFLSQDSFPIPFDGLNFSYDMKIKYAEINLPIVHLFVNYSLNKNEKESEYDYVQAMTFKSFLIQLIGISQENVSFYENSSTRELELFKLEGNFLTNYISGYSAYNLSKGAKNWSPFWINPENAILQGIYPIYSYYMPVNQTLELPANSMPLFNETRPVLTFNAQINLLNYSGANDNFTHKFGLIYDNITGILLKGVLDSQFRNNTYSISYVSHIELKNSNAFEKFKYYNLNNTEDGIYIYIPFQNNPIIIKLPPPNYIILGIILITPISIVISRLLRIKEIEGGSE